MINPWRSLAEGYAKRAGLWLPGPVYFLYNFQPDTTQTVEIEIFGRSIVGTWAPGKLGVIHYFNDDYRFASHFVRFARK
jgi:hypothetical protein